MQNCIQLLQKYDQAQQIMAILKQNTILNNKKPNKIKFEFKFQPSVFRKDDLNTLFDIAKEAGTDKVKMEANITEYFVQNNIFAINSQQYFTKQAQQEKQYNNLTNNQSTGSPMYQKPIQYKQDQQYEKIRQIYWEKYSKYRVKFSKILQSYKQYSQMEKLFIKHIQPASEFHMGIKETQEFKLMQQQWDFSIPFQQFKFEYDPSLQKPQEKLKLSGTFSSQKSVERYLKKEAKKYNQAKDQTSLRINLATSLQSSDDPLVRQAQYLLFDYMYGSGKPFPETPMCILSNGYNIASKNRYNEYFEAIERLNYTKYRVMIIDDNSKDNSIQVSMITCEILL